MDGPAEGGVVPADDEGRAPDLARERTDLAWNRSGLAVMVAVAIIVRRLWPLSTDGSVVALVLIGLGAGLWAAGMLFGRSRRHPGTPGAFTETTCRMLTIGTLALAAGAFLISFL